MQTVFYSSFHVHVFAFLPVIIRLFLETSGASSARSMLRWVSVRQTEGGRGVGGSVNQNNTLSWCEIRLTTTLQIWTHTHTFNSRLLHLPKDKHCSYLYWILSLLYFSVQPSFVLHRFLSAHICTSLCLSFHPYASHTPACSPSITQFPTHQKACQMRPKCSTQVSERSRHSYCQQEFC